MAIKPETLTQFKKAVVEVDKIVKARKAIDPKFKNLSAKLVAAMQAKDGPMIGLYLKALAATVNEITAAMHHVDIAYGMLGEIEEDEDFVAARTADLEKLMKIVSEARTSFTKEFEAAKQLENKGEKAQAASEDAGELQIRQLARLDRMVDEERKSIAALFHKAEALNDKASTAAEMHDARGLAEAQRAYAALDVSGALDQHEFAVNSVKVFGEQSAKNAALSAEVKDDIKDGVSDMQSKLAGTNAYVEQLQGLEKRIPGLKVEAIDITKAAKVLELDHQDAKIRKALDGPASGWERGLEALSKELRMKKNGKQLLLDLKRAKVL